MRKGISQPPSTQRGCIEALSPATAKSMWQSTGSEMRLDASENGDRRSHDFQLEHDPWGRLVLTDTWGAKHVGVEPVRAFPLSDAGHGISICDVQGRELVWIDRLDELAAPVRQMLEEHLARREFVPILKRITHVSSPIMPAEWEVETDR